MENIKEQFARLYIELDLTDDQAAMIKKLQRDVDAALRQPLVSGSASDFEMELYKLINKYVSAGLKKPDLVAKMEYVTQSCRVS